VGSDEVRSGEVFLAFVFAGALRALDFEDFVFEGFFFVFAFFAGLRDLDFFAAFLAFAIALTPY